MTDVARNANGDPLINVQALAVTVIERHESRSLGKSPHEIEDVKYVEALVLATEVLRLASAMAAAEMVLNDAIRDGLVIVRVEANVAGNPSHVLGVPIARIAGLIAEDRRRRTAPIVSVTGGDTIADLPQMRAARSREYVWHGIWHGIAGPEYLAHTDGGACHGTRLIDGRCPGCGIVPDMQSTSRIDG